MIKTIYIVRHGHFAVPHPRPINYDTKNQELSLAGIEDIIELSHKIKEKEKNIGLILSSPYKRALDTAKFFARLFHCPVETDDNITEDVMFFENIHHLEIIYKKFKDSVEKALDKDANSVMVSHELPISIYISKESGVTYEEMLLDHKHLELVRMGDCIVAKFNERKLIGFEKI